MTTQLLFVIQVSFLFFLLVAVVVMYLVAHRLIVLLDGHLERLQAKLDVMVAAQCEQQEGIEKLLQAILQ